MNKRLSCRFHILNLLLLLCLLPLSAMAGESSLVVTAPAGQTSLTMTFMGDCILGSEEKSRKLPESFDTAIQDEGYAWPFSGVAHILQADDLSVINLEGVFKDDRAGREDGKLHWFRGPTDFAQILPHSSIELAGLANNHVRDYGNAGRRTTKKALEDNGIPYFGYSDLHVWEKDGLKIGFGGIRETTFRQKPKLPAEEIQQLKEQGCHYIVYTIHAGKEYDNNHNKLQTRMAHDIIDAGANLVVGAHPHVVQGIEQYNDGLIIYSLGNFVFGGNLKLTEFEAFMLQVHLDFAGEALRETTLTLIPVFTTGARPANDFRPIPAEGEDKARILKRIQDDSGDLTITEVMRFPAAPAE
ncbi:MAG: CapA family protein [Clostridiales bacterium]|nr:CapA family protein [Clostridiales bacterium]